MKERAPSPYQGCDFEVSGLHESTAKCIRTRVGNQARTRLHAQSQADRHKNTRHRQKQSNPPTCTDSFILVSLDRVPGAPFRHVDAPLQRCARKFTTPAYDAINVDPRAVNIPFYPSQLYNSSLLLYSTLPQRSHRNPKRISAARLKRVSNCPRKVIAPAVHMGLSGSGTSQA